MKLTIFGATGGTGQHLVKKALERSHSVIAFARTPSKLALQHRNLTVLQGDVRNFDEVAAAIKGADGVISAIGPTPNSPDGLMQKAAENIVSAMKEHKIKRLIWSTGAGVRAPQDTPNFFQKSIESLLKLISGKVLENSLRGAEIIKHSDLDWTIARAPMLSDARGKSNYRIGFVGNEMGRTLSRENFAEFMLDLLEGDEWVEQMPVASDR